MPLTDRCLIAAGPSSLWRVAPAAATLVLLLAGLLLMPASARAHAFLERSDPEANVVLADAPESVRLWFTEPLEEQYSQAELYDSSGRRVETEASIVGPDDPYMMTLPLPDDLPNGTYSVQWHNVSSADGHPEQGYVPFTIGTQGGRGCSDASGAGGLWRSAG